MNLHKKIERQTQKISKIEKNLAIQRLRERRLDTRRKILLGVYALEDARKEGREKELFEAVSNYLTREQDKLLFNLAGIDKKLP
ncbi:MAG: hypothetical protein A3E87_02835 [Gammaproteobacteria bacterium RIFCSPHIGHO2_12_FULL_35_23]|nr:MAG: hypothetical protein A3E87_02835 [Gammaproteobacteria bacterium RIFCSPHIGHO2_12_FULL_35_23]